MDDIDRRSFLKKTAAGAVGIGVIGSGALPAVAKIGKVHADAASASEMNDHADRIVAYVRSGSRNEVTVLVGEREIVTRDAELARRLRRAAK